MAENILIEYIRRILLIHSPVVEPLGSLPNLNPGQGTAVNTDPQVSLMYLSGVIQVNRKV